MFVQVFHQLFDAIKTGWHVAIDRLRLSEEKPCRYNIIKLWSRLTAENNKSGIHLCVFQLSLIHLPLCSDVFEQIDFQQISANAWRLWRPESRSHIWRRLLIMVQDIIIIITTIFVTSIEEKYPFKSLQAHFHCTSLTHTIFCHYYSSSATGMSLKTRALIGSNLFDLKIM